MCLEVVFQNMPDVNCDDLQSCPLPKRNQKFETPLAIWAEQGPDGSTRTIEPMLCFAQKWDPQSIS